MRTISMRKAAAIQFASKYLNVAVQLILMAVLARLLTPSEFGSAAIISVLLSLASILSELGVGPAIVQFKDLSKSDYSGLFALSVILGIILSVLLCLGASPVAAFYRDQTLGGLCRCASIAVFFNAVNMVPNGILLKQKRFQEIGVRLVAASSLSGLVAIVFAYHGLGAFSMVWNYNCSAIFVFFFNILACRSLVGFSISSICPAVNKVFKYSGFQAGWGVINFFSRNLDSLLIGKFLGNSLLGYYDKAYKLVLYPINYLPGVFSSVLQPYLSEFQDNIDFIYNKYINLLKLVSLVAAPITALFLVAPDEIVLILYGQQWFSCVPLLRVLSVSLYFQMLNTIAGPILQSCGHTDYLFRHICIATALTIALLFFGLVSKDILIVSICVSLSYCMHTIPVIYYSVVRTFHQSVVKYLKIFVPDIAFIVISVVLIELVFVHISAMTILCFALKAFLVFTFWAIYIFFSGKYRMILSMGNKQSK